MRRNLAHLLSLAHERADRWLVAELTASALRIAYTVLIVAGIVELKFAA